jgi:multicomponent Na+:H+ antiporter subunit D
MGILSGDWFIFTIFVELSSLALFFMILLNDPKAARLYIFSQFSGAGLLLAGTALLMASTGSTTMGPVPGNILWLFLLGLGVKSAFPVLHFWLPEVHSKAPTPASALLSGFAVKIGIFGLARLVSPETGPVFLVIGPAMALYGVSQALLQHDAKRLLAYHTVSQLGYVVTAFAAGTPLGIAAGFFHAASHALFKSLLFLSVGTLEKAYGTKDLGRLGGTARAFPMTFLLFLVGALAISGSPGFSGFASKAMIKEALYGLPNPAISWALQAAGVGTVLSFCKMGFFGFIRRPRIPLLPDPSQMPGGRDDIFRNLGMLLPAMATILLGLFSSMFVSLAGVETGELLSSNNLVPAALTIAIGALFFLMLRKRLEPSSHDIPDIDTLARKSAVLFGPLLRGLENFNSGFLRLYISVVIAAGILLFFTLAS